MSSTQPVRPRTDPAARPKWKAAWRLARMLMREDAEFPQHWYKNEYIFEYIATMSLGRRETPIWLAIPVRQRLEGTKLTNRIIDEILAEEAENVAQSGSSQS